MWLIRVRVSQLFLLACPPVSVSMTTNAMSLVIHMSFKKLIKSHTSASSTALCFLALLLPAFFLKKPPEAFCFAYAIFYVSSASSSKVLTFLCSSSRSPFSAILRITVSWNSLSLASASGSSSWFELWLCSFGYPSATLVSWLLS